MPGELMLLGGLGAVFLAIAIALSTVGALTTERQQVGRSLAAVEAMEAAPKAMRGELERPFSERVLGPSGHRLVALGRRLTPEERLQRIRRRLDLAGNPAGWDVDRILAFKALFGLIGFVVGVAVPLLVGLGVLRTVFIAAAVTFGGWITPSLWLYQKAYDRSEQVRRELPDALDLLTISVEAGLAFDAAVAQVARNTTGPLAEEFFRVLQEMQIGTGRVDALRALGERTDVPELRSFVGAMAQADAFGIPIARVLRVQAKDLRVRRSQRAEEKAQKVPVKILFPLIFCILPSLFVIIMGPAAVSILRAFSGF